MFAIFKRTKKKTLKLKYVIQIHKSKYERKVITNLSSDVFSKCVTFTFWKLLRFKTALRILRHPVDIPFFKKT